MTISKPNLIFKIIPLAIVLLLCFVLDLFLGSEIFSPSDFFNSENQSIILKIRLPRALNAILIGASLSLCGVLLQTLFANPLAGPSVIGLNSGASLAIAISIMGVGLLGYSIFSPFQLIIPSIIGSSLVMILLLLFYNRYKSIYIMLIIGLMVGFFFNSLISILVYFSGNTELKMYSNWGMGSLSTILDLATILFSFLLLAIVYILCRKKKSHLDALLLGEKYAKSMGINTYTLSIFIIIICGVLSGGITAFFGPIAFVGIAVPHMIKLIFKTASHNHLIIFSFFCGGIFLLLCDILSKLPGSELVLPINAITSMIGAFVVLSIILNTKINA